MSEGVMDTKNYHPDTEVFPNFPTAEDVEISVVIPLFNDPSQYMCHTTSQST